MTELVMIQPRTLFMNPFTTVSAQYQSFFTIIDADIAHTTFSRHVHSQGTQVYSVNSFLKNFNRYIFLHLYMLWGKAFH